MSPYRRSRHLFTGRQLVGSGVALFLAGVGVEWAARAGGYRLHLLDDPPTASAAIRDTSPDSLAENRELLARVQRWRAKYQGLHGQLSQMVCTGEAP